MGRENVWAGGLAGLLLAGCAATLPVAPVAVPSPSPAPASKPSPKAAKASPTPRPSPTPTGSPDPLQATSAEAPPPCDYDGAEAAGCTFEIIPFKSYANIDAPRRAKVGEPIPVTLMPVMNDGCGRPYLPAFRAVVDDEARTVRFEGAKSYESGRMCAMAYWSTDVVVPFIAKQAGTYVLKATIEAQFGSGVSLQTWDHLRPPLLPKQGENPVATEVELDVVVEE